MERKKSNKETRTFRADMGFSEDGKTVTGYAALYDSPSEEMREWGVAVPFVEMIARGAFLDTDVSDVRALFNHDSNLLLGRTSSGTLTLERDNKGLKYSFELPDTSAGRDLGEMLRRGDVTQSSFGFSIDEGGERWEEREGQAPIRYITKVKRLYDVSPVTYPAYPDTTVAVRSFNEWQGQEPEKEEEETKETPLRDRAEALLLDNPNK